MSPAKSILMIRPASFCYNQETAANNRFQHDTEEEDIQLQALKQFDNLAALLKVNGVEVNVFQDRPLPISPDALFPNNWVSFHEDGTAILYPLFAPSRRGERRVDILQTLASSYQIARTIDLSYYEKQHQFLEGTGSFVLDHSSRAAYMCVSPRSTMEPFQRFCELMDYQPFVFEAVDKDGYPIYHTNVMLCIGPSFGVWCEEAIRDRDVRKVLTKAFEQANKEMIPISYSQMAHFAANMLVLSNKLDEQLLVMSEQAFLSFAHKQRICLEKHARLLYAPLDIIERVGGGGARCMIAEIFLPLKNTTA